MFENIKGYYNYYWTGRAGDIAVGAAGCVVGGLLQASGKKTEARILLSASVPPTFYALNSSHDTYQQDIWRKKMVIGSTVGMTSLLAEKLFSSVFKGSSLIFNISKYTFSSLVSYSVEQKMQKKEILPKGSIFSAIAGAGSQILSTVTSITMSRLGFVDENISNAIVNFVQPVSTTVRLAHDQSGINDLSTDSLIGKVHSVVMIIFSITQGNICSLKGLLYCVETRDDHFNLSDYTRIVRNDIISSFIQKPILIASQQSADSIVAAGNAFVQSRMSPDRYQLLQNVSENYLFIHVVAKKGLCQGLNGLTQQAVQELLEKGTFSFKGIWVRGCVDGIEEAVDALYISYIRKLNPVNEKDKKTIIRSLLTRGFTHLVSCLSRSTTSVIVEQKLNPIEHKKVKSEIFKKTINRMFFETIFRSWRGLIPEDQPTIPSIRTDEEDIVIVGELPASL